MQSVNQVRQFYVAKAVASGAVSAKGDVKIVAPTGKDFVFVQHMGEGGATRSDLIKKDQIISATCTKASTMKKTLKQAVLTLDSNVSATPIALQDYVVDIQVSNYIALGDENVLVKFGAVHATAGMTASDFYIALAKSFVRNFSRDINKFFRFYVATDTTTASTYEEVTMTSTHTGTYTGVIISEIAQDADYILGEAPVRLVNFKVIPHTVYQVGDEVQPFVTDGTTGTVKNESKKATSVDTVIAVGNGYDVADLEWFCMGERGDQYRQVGYPRTIRTKYMVDPTQQYHLIDINFYFQGRGVGVQKSEKLLTLAVPAGAAGTDETVLKAINKALNTALGTSLTPNA